MGYPGARVPVPARRSAPADPARAGPRAGGHSRRVLRLHGRYYPRLKKAGAATAATPADQFCPGLRLLERHRARPEGSRAAGAEVGAGRAAGTSGRSDHAGLSVRPRPRGGQNDAEAVRLLRAAIAQGYGDAMFNPGRLHARGQGVPKSDSESRQWLEKALRAGSVDAAIALRDAREQELKKPAAEQASAAYQAYRVGDLPVPCRYEAGKGWPRAGRPPTPGASRARGSSFGWDCTAWPATTSSPSASRTTAGRRSACSSARRIGATGQSKFLARWLCAEPTGRALVLHARNMWLSEGSATSSSARSSRSRTASARARAGRAGRGVAAAAGATAAARSIRYSRIATAAISGEVR